MDPACLGAWRSFFPLSGSRGMAWRTRQVYLSWVMPLGSPLLCDLLWPYLLRFHGSLFVLFNCSLFNSDTLEV